MKGGNFQNRIYLDNAATSFPKPQAVIQKTLMGLYNYSGNPGRGGHSVSKDASRAIFSMRLAAADFFQTSREENVIVTGNTTHALNIALKSILRQGQRVLCSNIEHNAVRRVLLCLEKTRDIKIFTFDALLDDSAVLQSIEDGIKRKKASVVVLPHASNICSRILPLEKIGKICRENGACLVVDGAQSAGHVPIFFDDWGIDALCISGHKGLFAPAGIGLLIVSEKFKELEKGSDVLITGGAGIDSESPEMPEVYPEHLEAGTLSAPLAMGLEAGIRLVSSIGIKKIAEKEILLGNLAKQIISSRKEAVIYRPDLEGGIVSFNLRGISPERAAEYFDSFGICLRAGLHCAPTAHQSIGSFLEFGGSLRLSAGYFNTPCDIQRFGQVLLSMPLK